MACVFRELATDRGSGEGILGFSFVWLRVLGDFARTVPAEHWTDRRTLRGGLAMNVKIVAHSKTDFR